MFDGRLFEKFCLLHIQFVGILSLLFAHVEEKVNCWIDQFKKM